MATEPVRLTPDQVDTLLQAERIIHDLLPQLDHLEECGHDCKLLRQQAMSEAEKSRTLRQRFAPRDLATRQPGA